jgi:hypothetical protein
MLATCRFSRKLAKDYNENLFWLEKSPPCLWPLAKLPPEPAFDKIVRIHITFPSKILLIIFGWDALPKYLRKWGSFARFP